MRATFVAVILAIANFVSAVDFSGHMLLQANPNSEEHLKILRELDEKVPEDVIDFFSEPVSVGTTVEFLVEGLYLEEVKKILTEADLEFEVKADNYQRMIDDQMKQIWDEDGKFILRSPGEVPDPRKDFNLFNYHDLDSIYAYISQVQTFQL